MEYQKQQIEAIKEKTRTSEEINASLFSLSHQKSFESISKSDWGREKISELKKLGMLIDAPIKDKEEAFWDEEIQNKAMDFKRVIHY